MNMQIVCLLAVLFTNMIIGVGMVLAFLYLAKVTKSDTELKDRMFLFSLPINDEDNLLILDKLIQREMEVYEIYNFPLNSDELYINEKDQKLMVKVVLSNVLKKISPVYMNKLKYIYNEDIIEDIIFEKIRDAVLNFTVEINGQFRDQVKK